jgi:hypothetical protein
MRFPAFVLRSCAFVSWLFDLGCSAPESPSSLSSGGSHAVASGGEAGAGLGAGGVPGSGGSGGVAGTSGVAGASCGGGASSGGDNECEPSAADAISYAPRGGTFQGTISVALTTQVAGAEIRYTTDRTSPGPSSSLYGGTPLELTSTTELRSQAFVQGVPAGAPQVEVYIARTFDQPHDLPVLILDSYGRELPAEGFGQQGSREFIDVAVLAFEPNGGKTSFAAPPTVATPAGFHLRGQSSATYPKRPYRVELRDALGEDRDCPLFGMPSEADWVLHSPYPDKALIRNAFVYGLGPAVGLRAPRAALAEVYVNTAGRALEPGDYQGVYLLVETLKNQKNRLNLKQLAVTDTALPAISGGYMFKFEWQVTSIEQELVCPSGGANCWNSLEVVDPRPWNVEQQNYLASHLLDFSAALRSPMPSDPATGYPAFIDTGSFVNHVIVNELTRSLDAYTRSQFFYKDRDDKIFAGPLWDFDLIAGVGSASAYQNLAVEGWQYESVQSRFGSTADWFPTLLADPAFSAALVARWKELRQGPLSNAEVTARINGLTAGLSAAAARNFQKWDILATQRVGFFDTPTAETWQGQVQAMQHWLLARMAWLDSEWQ